MVILTTLTLTTLVTTTALMITTTLVTTTTHHDNHDNHESDHNLVGATLSLISGWLEPQYHSPISGWMEQRDGSNQPDQTDNDDNDDIHDDNLLQVGWSNGMAHSAPRLSLPGKLVLTSSLHPLFIFYIHHIFCPLQVFPSSHTAGHFSMLGLGDVVMPGLLLCFVMRYDAYKRAQVLVVIWLLLVVTMATMVLIMVVLRIEKELK